MRRHTSAAATAIAALAFAAPAQGQTLVLFGGAPGKVLAVTDIPVSVSGQLVVSFEGDTASGCAVAGLCAYSGRVVLQPASGDILVIKYRQGGVTRAQGALELGDGIQTSTASARVERGSGSGLCADSAQSTSGSGGFAVAAGKVTLSLLDKAGDLLATRCAGPVDGDLASAGPDATIPLSALLRGRTRISLAGSSTFASHGFAGTVDSSVELRLGAPQPQSLSGSNQFPPGLRTERVRTVTERFSGVSGAGALTVQIRGSRDSTECQLLDTCGLSGSLTLTPGYRDLVGSFDATGPAKRPYRDFLAALGIGRGNPRGIQVFGSVGSLQDGTLSAALSQAGTCNDTVSTTPGEVLLTADATRVTARYVQYDPLRTRCPGPMLSPDQTLASGTTKLRLLGRRSFTISLTGNSPFIDDGYTGRTGGRITLTLRRGRITQQISTQPAGF